MTNRFALGTRVRYIGDAYDDLETGTLVEDHGTYAPYRWSVRPDNRKDTLLCAESELEVIEP